MKSLDKNKKAFNVPENYFKNLEETIISARFLNKDLGHKVPENYFLDLESNVVKTEKTSKVRKLIFTITSVAASVILLTTIYFSFFVNEDSTKYMELTKQHSEVVDEETEDAVYESLYKSYFAEDTKKSSNEITLDDLDDFYAER